MAGTSPENPTPAEPGSAPAAVPPADAAPAPTQAEIDAALAAAQVAPEAAALSAEPTPTDAATVAAEPSAIATPSEPVTAEMPVTEATTAVEEPSHEPLMSQESLDALAAEFSADDQAAPSNHTQAPMASKPLDLPDFGVGMAARAEITGIELLNDVELDVKIELGRAMMRIEDVLKLGDGAVVELDKLAGDPVDVLVNDRLVARGEVLVLNENFCVRISEIIAGPAELSHAG